MTHKECIDRYLRCDTPPVIIDAHAHLWLWQHTTVNNREIRQMPDGRSMFLGKEVQMMNPWMHDNYNSAEKLLANMDYAQVGGAVITQEFIDGLQNDYLDYASRRWPERFFVYGMCDCRQPGFIVEAQTLLRRGFKGIKLPAARLIDDNGRIRFDTPEFMEMFKMMERHGMILHIELADGDVQCGELENVISECPRLKIVIGHFCMATREGWMSQVMMARHPNVYIDMGGVTWLYNDEYYPYPSAIRAMREAAGAVGMDKIMWGSDYPRTITAITYRQSYDWILLSEELTDSEKYDVLGRTAEQVYGFSDIPHLRYIPNMSE